LYVIDKNNGEALETQILIDFGNKIFALLKADVLKSLIKEILSTDHLTYKSILSNKVSLRFKQKNLNNNKVSELKQTWENFANEIKHINRFHISNAINPITLKELISRYNITIPAKQLFYRARIAANKNKFNKKDLQNPPPEFATSGRANPEGISYLYLSKSIRTTFYEARASSHDIVFIGQFISKEEINVVNLDTENFDPIPFAEKQVLEDYLTYIPFIKKLENELSKPKLRGDNDLDYLPTQYLSEFIKSIGFDGLEFKSTLHTNGSNLAIFNPQKFECLKVTKFNIIEMEYKEQPKIKD
jgi:hypothetical protein